MFFFRHPRPVVDGRAVAVQVVQQKLTGAQATTVLVAADPAPQAASEPRPAETDLPLRDQ